MGNLADWAQKNSPFLKVGDNMEVEVVYKGYKEVDDERNPGGTKIRYIVELAGEDKWFESRSGSVAYAFDEIGVGTTVVIRKNVDGKKTRYEVEPVTSVVEDITGAKKKSKE